MIKNELQYRNTNYKAQELRKSIGQLQSGASIESSEYFGQDLTVLQNELNEIERQIEDFRELQSGQRTVPDLTYHYDLPRHLIQCRIGLGLTQRELANKLNISEQQLQRYEASDYQSTSFARIRQVMDALRSPGPEQLVIRLMSLLKSPPPIPCPNDFWWLMRDHWIDRYGEDPGPHMRAAVTVCRGVESWYATQGSVDQEEERDFAPAAEALGSLLEYHNVVEAFFSRTILQSRLAPLLVGERMVPSFVNLWEGALQSIWISHRTGPQDRNAFHSRCWWYAVLTTATNVKLVETMLKGAVVAIDQTPVEASINSPRTP